MKRLNLILAGVLFCRVLTPTTTYADQVSRQALALAVQENYAEAFKTAKKTADPLVSKIINWLRLTSAKTPVPFSIAEKFIKENPGWPRIYMIRRNAEQTLLSENKKSALEKWFKAYPPVSVDAALAYTDILLERKEWEKALPTLHNLWASGALNENEAEAVKKKLRYLLDEHDYASRVDKLLDERKTTQTKKWISLIDDDSRKLALARIELLSNGKNAKKALKELSVRQQQDKGLVLDQIRWFRMNKKFDSAAKLIHSTPAQKQNNPKWWSEKSLLIRQFLNDGNPHDAYALASHHDLKSGVDFADAEWMAGWIALRNLKKQDLARKHFEKMLSAVSSPLSLSRGQYWLARTLEEQNKPDEAFGWYEKASAYVTTIYGQLSAQKIKNKKQNKPLPPEIIPGKETLDRLKKSELVRVMKILEDAALHELVDLFATRMYNDAKTPEETAAIARILAEDVKREDLAVMIARRARQTGLDLVLTGYPVWNLKHDEATETALVLSIIRQESSFSRHAVSPVGARGLMQIMPSTAKQVARKKKKAFSPQLLNSNPDFNVEIGSSYFADLLKRFEGSYILAIAAYNAGPTNVKKWIKAYGKPEEDMDSVDWIENIPFGETRNYVQRVLENLHVYRRRLNYEEKDLTLWAAKTETVYP